MSQLKCRRRMKHAGSRTLRNSIFLTSFSYLTVNWYPSKAAPIFLHVNVIGLALMFTYSVVELAIWKSRGTWTKIYHKMCEFRRVLIHKLHYINNFLTIIPICQKIMYIIIYYFGHRRRAVEFDQIPPIDITRTYAFRWQHEQKSANIVGPKKRMTFWQ